MLMLLFHFIGFFFFKSKWKLLLRRIDYYYLKNGEFPLRPQSVNTTTKKVAFMSETNNEWKNPHSKLRSSIRLVISFFPLSSTFYFDFKKKTKTLVHIISCLQFPSSLGTFIITTSHLSKTSFAIQFNLSVFASAIPTYIISLKNWSAQ